MSKDLGAPDAQVRITSLLSRLPELIELLDKLEIDRALSEIDKLLRVSICFCLDSSDGFPVTSGSRHFGSLQVQRSEGVEPLDETQLSFIKNVSVALGNALARKEQLDEEIECRTRAERRLSRLSQSGVIGVLYVDLGGQILDANDSFLNLLGYRREELETGELRFNELTPESEWHLNETAIRELQERGVCQPFEKHYFAKDGSLVPVRIVSLLLEDDDATAMTLVQDLREQRKILDQLGLHSALLDRMVEGVSLSDEQGYIVYTNPAEDRIFGYEPGELVGQHVSVQNTYDPEENERIIGGVISQLSTIGFWEGEFSNKKKDGTPFITRARISSVQISGKHHFLCVQEDITKAKEDEDAREFLAKASELLASSLDYRQTLQNLADLVVPTFAEWCGVDSFTEQGALDRIAVAHADPEKVKWARMIHERYPTDLDAPHGVPNVLRTGVAEIYPDIPEEMLAAAAKNDEHLAIIREANIRSAMVVPLISRGKVIAALTFVSGIPGFYNNEKLRIADDLARRAGLAVDNAMLFAETRQQLEELTLLNQRLAESEARARQLIDSMPQIAWVQSPAQENEYLNRRYYEYTGLDRDFDREVAWAEVVHPEDMDLAKNHYIDCFSQGVVWEEQLRLRNRHGTYRWHLSRLVPIRDEHGQIVRWLGTSTDIHDQKLREMNALFLSELGEQTRALSDPFDVMRVTAQKLGEHLRVDRCAYAEVEEDEDHFVILGDYNAQGVPSIVGRYAMSSFGAEVLEKMRAGETYVVSDVDSHGLADGEIPAYRGTQIQAVICSSVHKGGKFLAAMAVHQRQPRTWTPEEVELVDMVTDRSWSAIERARANQRLQELNEELEVRVEERTRNLEAFSYSVSHDLRTPLRNIATASSLLFADYSDALGEDAKQLVRDIGSSAKRMSVLITELLEHARLGSKPMQISRVDMSGLANEALADVLSRDETASQDTVTIHPGMTVEGDPILLRVVLQNLIENALKFSKMRAEPKVEVGKHDGAFFVRDNGIGFDPAYSHKVFEPFETLHSREEFAGTGIGLANVRKIVERHGGSIWAESQPGQGATFFFSL